MSNINIPSIDSLRPEYNKLKAIQYLYSAVKELQQEGFASFDSSSSYSKGDIVQKDGKLYEFTTSHTGDWNENDVQETTLDNIIQSKTSSIETTYSELKSLRDNSQLIPGCWYRITDYVTTVSSIIEPQARSVGHPFDILVLATSANTLSEEAKAIQSERDKELQSITLDITLIPYVRSKENDGDFEGQHYYAFLSEGQFIYVKSLVSKPTQDSVYFFTDENDIHTFVPINIAVNINTLEEPGDEVDSYTGLYFSNSNLNAWQLKYTLDNIQWSQQSGIYVFDEDDNYVFHHIGEIELDGTQYHLLKGFGLYVDDWGDYAVCEDFEVGTDIIAYYGNPDEFDPEYRDIAGTITNTEDITDDGKGTITFLKDEFNNECPYDFKNIQFKRYMTTDSVTGRNGLNGLYMVANPNHCARNLSVANEGDFIWAFTFSSNSSGGNQEDYSLGGHDVYENVFKPYSLGLPNNVIYGDFNYGNIFNIDCSYNSFDNGCNSNSFSSDCYYNSCGGSYYHNSCGNSCNSNSFGYDCSGNSFGKGCSGNSFGKRVKLLTLFEVVHNININDDVRYAQVLSGVVDSKGGNTTLNFTPSVEYTQVAALNSSGQLKIYVPGDLVQ